MDHLMEDKVTKSKGSQMGQATPKKHLKNYLRKHQFQLPENEGSRYGISV